MRKILLVIIVAAALTGCRQDRYQIVGTEGVAYILEKRTGEVWFCQNGGCSKVQEALDEEKETPAATTDEWDVFKK